METPNSDSELKVQELKSAASSHFSKKRYREAAEIYTEILETYANKADPETMRTVRCNRAACDLELEMYGRAASDCTLVLDETRPSSSKEITKKAHFRLSRSLYGLGPLDQAIVELDKYQALNGGSNPAEQDLRTKIQVRQQAARDRAAELKSNSAGSMRSVFYNIRTGLGPIAYYDEVDSTLCVSNAPKQPLTRYLTYLVNKYERRLMAEREWDCWHCPKKATCMVHTPCAYLHLPDPMVVDYVQPVCVNGGGCDKAAREFVDRDLAPVLSKK